MPPGHRLVRRGRVKCKGFFQAVRMAFDRNRPRESVANHLRANMLGRVLIRLLMEAPFREDVMRQAEKVNDPTDIAFICEFNGSDRSLSALVGEGLREGSKILG